MPVTISAPYAAKSPLASTDGARELKISGAVAIDDRLRVVVAGRYDREGGTRLAPNELHMIRCHPITSELVHREAPHGIVRQCRNQSDIAAKRCDSHGNIGRRASERGKEGFGVLETREPGGVA